MLFYFIKPNQTYLYQHCLTFLWTNFTLVLSIFYIGVNGAGIKYYCDQCDHSSNRIADLKLHIFSVHESKEIVNIFLCNYWADLKITNKVFLYKGCVLLRKFVFYSSYEYKILSGQGYKSDFHKKKKILCKKRKP